MAWIVAFAFYILFTDSKLHVHSLCVSIYRYLTNTIVHFGYLLDKEKEDICVLCLKKTAAFQVLKYFFVVVFLWIGY